MSCVLDLSYTPFSLSLTPSSAYSLIIFHSIFAVQSFHLSAVFNTGRALSGTLLDLHFDLEHFHKSSIYFLFVLCLSPPPHLSHFFSSLKCIESFPNSILCTCWTLSLSWFRCFSFKEDERLETMFFSLLSNHLLESYLCNDKRTSVSINFTTESSRQTVG